MAQRTRGHSSPCGECSNASDRDTLCWVVPVPLICLAAAALGDDQVALVKTILAAWEEREESFRSYQYECDVEVVRPRAGLASLDQALADSPEMAVFHNRILLTVSGKKVAYYKEAESWDAASNSMTTLKFKSVYDGTHGRFLIQGAPMALAHESSGETASDVVRRDKELSPLWFLHAPVSQLDLFGFDPKMMRVTRVDSSHDGRDCVELSVPPSSRLPPPPPGVTAPSFRYVILADTTRGFLPVHLRELHDGSPAYEVSISHVPDDSLGWVASEFHAHWFESETGVPRMSWRYRVKHYLANQPVDASAFAMEFPPDTHIVEADNIFSGDPASEERRYSVQLPDGRRRPISEDDFGRLPQRNVAGTIGLRLTYAIIGAVLLALLIFVMRQRWMPRASLP
jgi:hypothetical protein